MTSAETDGQTTRRGRGRPRVTYDRTPLDGRRPRDREVLEAAIHLFYAKGYAATSIQDIADELGILKGSVYYYIDSKSSLLGKIFEDSQAEAQAIAERCRAAGGSPVEQIGNFLREFSMWFLEHSERASLWDREWRHAEGEMRELMAGQRRFYDEVVRQLIEDAIAAGEAAPGLDSRLAANFILSALTSLPDRYESKGRSSREEIAEAYARLASNALGLKPPTV